MIDFKQRALSWVAGRPRSKFPFGKGGLWTPEGHEMVDSLESALRSAVAEALEEAELRIRADCGACGGSGIGGVDGDPERPTATECEYCGRPMRPVRALAREVRDG